MHLSSGSYPRRRSGKKHCSGGRGIFLFATRLNTHYYNTHLTSIHHKTEHQQNKHTIHCISLMRAPAKSIPAKSLPNLMRSSMVLGVPDLSGIASFMHAYDH
jgi:hypothetical protein